MKYLYIKLAVIGALLFSGAPFAFADVTVTPNPMTDVNVEWVVGGSNAGHSCFLFAADGSYMSEDDKCANWQDDDTTIQDACNDRGTSCLPINGTWNIVEVTSRTDTCRAGGGTDAFNLCTASPQFVSLYPFVIGVIQGGGGGNCGLGCAGLPTAYTANFSSSTQQAAAIGAIGDLSSFAFGYIPYIIALLFALIIIGFGVRWIRNKLSGKGDWSASPINKTMYDQNKKDGLF